MRTFLASPDSFDLILMVRRRVRGGGGTAAAAAKRAVQGCSPGAERRLRSPHSRACPPASRAGYQHGARAPPAAPLCHVPLTDCRSHARLTRPPFPACAARDGWGDGGQGHHRRHPQRGPPERARRGALRLLLLRREGELLFRRDGAAAAQKTRSPRLRRPPRRVAFFCSPLMSVGGLCARPGDAACRRAT